MKWRPFYLSLDVLKIIGVCKDLAPNRPIAIARNIDDAAQWSVYVSLAIMGFYIK